MKTKSHGYAVTVQWTGNTGTGTQSYRGYRRDHEITAQGKPVIAGSADPAFRGDQARWNPEELLLASISSCHQLWYLGLCAQAGIVVRSYQDNAEGTMVEGADGAGQFSHVVLRPHVVIDASSDRLKAHALHQRAHEFCFIARSLNFAVTNEPQIVVTAEFENLPL